MWRRADVGCLDQDDGVAVARELAVSGDQTKGFRQRLGNQQAIERVAMQRIQFFHRYGMGGINRQDAKPSLLE